ncbi:hypothetical protein BGZ98_003463 [Dissophora globulifera]|nr:hypothetical protein BGZ98_003463 [Dissophora globulifera]
MDSPSSSNTTSCRRPSMPPECLERIVFHASDDHRVLSTLMQVNTTLFRIATPYLYREPFRFVMGDEFLLDWDTTTWTRHLREVRHAKLLLLYLKCTENIQTLEAIATANAVGKGKGVDFWTGQRKERYRSQQTTTDASTTLQSQQLGDVHATFPLEAESSTAGHALPTALPLERIPPLLQKLVASGIDKESIAAPSPALDTSLSLSLSPSISSSISARRRSLFGSKRDSSITQSSVSPSSSSLRTINYLDYVEHLDLDQFLSKAIQVLLSSSSAPGVRGTRRMSSPSPPTMGRAAHYLSRGNHCTAERAFTERILLRSTAQHITTLSISVGTFARLQRDLMDPILESSPLSSASSSRVVLSGLDASLSGAVPSPPRSTPTPQPSTSTTTITHNSAGIRTGEPLSQLSRLNISGLHAELKPKVMRAVRWFLRRHATVYPGVLKAVSFEGPGDSVISRRRQRNRNVIGAEPILPGVVHFNNQHAGDEDEDDDLVDGVEEDGSGFASTISATNLASASEALYAEMAGHANNIVQGQQHHQHPTPSSNNTTTTTTTTTTTITITFRAHYRLKQQRSCLQTLFQQIFILSITC